MIQLNCEIKQRVGLRGRNAFPNNAIGHQFNSAKAFYPKVRPSAKAEESP